MVIHKESTRQLKILGLSVLLSISTASTAQPVGDRVLAGADIEKTDGCTTIRVGFEQPIMYLSHFPEKAGDELRIQLRLRSTVIARDDDMQPFDLREGTHPPFDEDIGLLSVELEGRAVSAELTLEFRRPLMYKVRQGRDYRSVLVGIPGPKTSGPCP